jgi:hypothetical protein
MVNNNWALTQVHRKGGRQMGINPCPLSSPTVPNRGQQLGINPGSPDGGQQVGINPYPYTMGDGKWESTHVRQTYLLGAYSHKMVGKGWDKAYKTHW